MRNSEIGLGIDFQINSPMISLAFEQDYCPIGKIYVLCNTANEEIYVILHNTKTLLQI